MKDKLKNKKGANKIALFFVTLQIDLRISIMRKLAIVLIFFTSLADTNESKKQMDAAKKLLESLKDKARKNPKIFVENYGEKELRKFEDKLEKTKLTFAQKHEVMQVLFTIHDFSPLEV